MSVHRSRPARLARRSRRRLAAALAVPLLGLLAGCGAAADAQQAPEATGPADTLRLGYLANVTHAAAIVGVDEGFIPDALGDTALQTQVFNAGPAAVEALFAGAVDATYIGPNPAINAYGQSDGEAVRIVAGATSGGAQLVVRSGTGGPGDLAGTTLATPQLGNTQDVALRAWLSEQGLATSVTGGGDVTVSPTANADTLTLFQAGELDGAWLPEPWSSRLVLEAGATVLVDEADLWPDGQFVTTHLVVRTQFLQDHPDTVRALLEGHVEAVDWAVANPDQAKTAVNAGIEDLTGQRLAPAVLDRAWDNLQVTVDPVPGSLAASAEDAVTAGVAEDEVDLDGIYDLSILNAIRTEQGQPAISAGGLGKE